MKCEICGNDPKSIVILPKRQENGSLITLSCEPCAIASGMYCEKHQRPHQGFMDETTACIPCIEEILKQDGEKIAGSFAVAVAGSDKASEIQAAIRVWSERLESGLSNVSLIELPGFIDLIRTKHPVRVARLVVTYSQRMHMTPDEAIKKVVEEGPDIILPPSL